MERDESDHNTRDAVPRARGFSKTNLAASALRDHTMEPVRLEMPENLSPRYVVKRGTRDRKGRR